MYQITIDLIKVCSKLWPPSTMNASKSPLVTVAQGRFG